LARLAAALLAAFLTGAAAVVINVFQALLLFLAFLLVGGLGAHYYSTFGIWGMLPAIVLGLFFVFLACVGIVKSLGATSQASRQKKETTANDSKRSE